MSSEGWSDEGGESPRKKRVPVWVWWTCGGGCLLMALVGIAVAVVTLNMAKGFLDPEKAWEEVRVILPYDQRPSGWDARGGSVFGVGSYFLTPSEPDVILVVQRFRRTMDIDAMFDPASRQNRGMPFFEEIRAPESGTLELQGREVRVLRFRGGLPEELSEGPGGSGIRIDLGRPERHALVQISLEGPAGEAPVSDERVRELLAPFDLWREP